MVDFNDLRKDTVVSKIINNHATFRNKSFYNNQNKFPKFLNSIENVNYEWKYCANSE